MSKFQELVESKFNEDSLNEGLRSAINNSKIGRKINDGGSNISSLIGEKISRTRFVDGLTTKSSKSQLSGATAHLNHFAKSKDEINKISDIVVNHPHATSSQLNDVIYNSRSPSHILAAVNHPNASIHTLRSATMHGDGNPDLMKAIINHPKADKDVFNSVTSEALSKPNHPSLQDLAHHPSTPSYSLGRIADKAMTTNNHALITTIAHHPSTLSHTLSSLASKTDLPPELINKIANHPNASESTHYTIANNKNTSTHTLKQLASKGDTGFMASAIVRHPNTDPATIHKVVNQERNADGTEYRHVAGEAAKNPNTSSETLDSIASDIGTHHSFGQGHAHIIDTLLAHPNTPASALRTIYNNHSSHREMAMNHPNGGALRKFALPKG